MFIVTLGKEVNDNIKGDFQLTECDKTNATLAILDHMTKVEMTMAKCERLC